MSSKVFDTKTKKFKKIYNFTDGRSLHTPWSSDLEFQDSIPLLYCV